MFINDDFLLENKYAQALYHDYAKSQPIIDYHCHLPPELIATNHQFEDITEIWLKGDHYKWRAMRTFGISEAYITGGASSKDKFKHWAKTVPYTMRNPLYHWTHMELQRYFGITDLLHENNADKVYELTQERLKDASFSTQALLHKMKVEVVCTTEDPLDNLQYHQQLATQDIGLKVSTSFRPDKAILIGNDGFNDYVDELAKVCDTTIANYQDLLQALSDRVEYFHSNGCKLSDHGLEYLTFETFTESEVQQIFAKRRKGEAVSKLEDHKFQTAVLLFLAELYHEKGWVQQFHLGALRNNNTRMEKILGPDTGWDSIGDFSQAQNLSKFLNALDGKDKLAKTILYNLNPADNEVMATMIGNFNDGSVKGKVQFGSGWWFLDQKDGMIKQMNALSNMGLISCFVGMLTDSRSFMSYPRHEYFRRIVCNLFGQEIEKGELPNDLPWIGKLVSDISYHNAKNYFEF